MIKLNIFLLLVSLIVANQLEEIVYKGILTSNWLNDNAPRNYGEYSSSVAGSKNIREGLDVLSSYVANWKLELNEKIKELELSDSRTNRLERLCSDALNYEEFYLKMKIRPSLYPYINQKVIGCMFHHIENLCKHISDHFDRFHEQYTSKQQDNIFLEKNINTMLDNWDRSNYDLGMNTILFYTFITTSENAVEHRKIHLKEKISLKDVVTEVTCILCMKIIQKDYYVFSLLCKHQFHVTCMSKVFSKEGLIYWCPVCKENIWEKVPLTIKEEEEAACSSSHY